MRALLVLVLVLAVGACARAADPSEPATYEPVPDSQLQREIADVPGLERGTVRYQEGFGKTGYYGTLYAAEGSDAADVLDHVLAILWQGRPDRSTFGTVFVVPAEPDQPRINATLVGLSMPSDYRERYGPRPGTGEPPADAPALRVQG